MSKIDGSDVKYNTVEIIGDIGMGHHLHRDGGSYTVVDFCQLQIDGKWVSGVVYTDGNVDKITKRRNLFVRSIDDFKSSFRKVVSEIGRSGIFMQP